MINLETELASQRILIIDDLVEARTSLKKMMVTLGAGHIDTAVDGNEAMKFLREYDYDMVLSDYNLGKGKDGQQVLEESRYSHRLRSTALFIMVTGENAVDMVMGALEYDPDAYLTKPFTLNMLRERLARIVNIKAQLQGVNKAIDESRIDDAIAEAEVILQKRPKLLMPLTRILGRLYIQKERYQDAIQTYDRLLKVRSVSWARLGHAICMHHLGDSHAAIAQLKQTLSKHPLYVQCYDWLARITLELGQPEEAQKFLQKAVDISPKAVLRQMELGQLASANEDFDTAEQAFDAAVRLGRFSCYKQSKNYIDFAQAVQSRISPEGGRDSRLRADKVMRYIEELRQDYADNSGVMFDSSIVEGQTFHRMGQEEKARKSANHAEEILSRIENPSLDQQLQMTEAYIETDQHVKAKKLLRQLQKQGLDSDAIEEEWQRLDKKLNDITVRKYTAELNSKGVEYYEKGLLEQAVEAFDEAADFEEAGISVLLNAIQAKISFMEEKEIRVSYLKDCHKMFKRIGPIGDADERFERYDRLKNTYLRLKRAAGL
jgi:tetratricopeptide (TPR) repeat protein